MSLDEYSDVVLLKLVEQKRFGTNISEVLRNIIQDWMNSNRTRLIEWGIDLNQIGKDLLDQQKANNPKNISYSK